MMNEHGFLDELIPRRKLITKISQNLPNIVISEHRGNLPGIPAQRNLAAKLSI